MPFEDTDRGRPRALWWGAVLTSVGAFSIGAAVWIGGVDHGPTPSFLASAAEPPEHRQRSSDAVVIAGSGSNLPITRALATAHAAVGIEAPVVHTSIGSGGGIRALRDGAIDIALISRSLKPDERAAGLVAVPYARAPVVFAVHGSVPDRSLSAGELLAIYSGEQTSWSDGTSVVVLQRERGDSSHAAVGQLLPEFEDVNEQAYQQRRWRVLYNDAAMEDALASTEGGIGLVGSGTLPQDLPIRGLAYDNVIPSVAAVRDGSYPFYKDLSFVTVGEPEGAAAQLIRFALSPEGRAVIEAHGCVPLGGNGPRAAGGT
ncbi:MAG: substrate-binding domain-containing protein [Deltaproteobacteria bacterium]|nr:substrate-binding domain-containing protein [Nannocystaceae bacterium]